MSLYSYSDWKREVKISKDGDPEPYRSAVRRDYARLIHCPSFRRLQGKTQVFPGSESDFFRNRLTHSLEVAQIAKSIAIRLNAKSKYFKSDNINPDLVELAALAHDLGHPPFGHNGEKALDECMSDFGGFEGNAQTLRIISRIEKKEIIDLAHGVDDPITSTGIDRRVGLNFTYRALAAVLKYDKKIPQLRADRDEAGIAKGYYFDDEGLVSRIKKNVAGPVAEDFKTIECSIMDIADDIAYSTYDLEDIFKGKFLSPVGLLSLDEAILKSAAAEITKRARKQYKKEIKDNFVFADVDIYDVIYSLFYDMFAADAEEKNLFKDKSVSYAEKKILLAQVVQNYSKLLANVGYYRTALTSNLVQRFISGVEVSKNNIPQLHQAKLRFDVFLEVEVLKNITHHAVIRSPMMQVVEYRGSDIVKKIFGAISAPNGERLLPSDFRAVWDGGSLCQRMRTICDFIAGMTDRYAIEFYTRLFGAEGLTIHKPL